MVPAVGLYAPFNVGIMLSQTGQFSGWFGILVGVMAVIGAFQCAKESKEYQARSYAASASFVERQTFSSAILPSCTGRTGTVFSARTSPRGDCTTEFQRFFAASPTGQKRCPFPK
jgi:hypothetical protein